MNILNSIKGLKIFEISAAPVGAAPVGSTTIPEQKTGEEQYVIYDLSDVDENIANSVVSKISKNDNVIMYQFLNGYKNGSIPSVIAFISDKKNIPSVANISASIHMETPDFKESLDICHKYGVRFFDPHNKSQAETTIKSIFTESGASLEEVTRRIESILGKESYDPDSLLVFGNEMISNITSVKNNITSLSKLIEMSHPKNKEQLNTQLKSLNTKYNEVLKKFAVTMTGSGKTLQKTIETKENYIDTNFRVSATEVIEFIIKLSQNSIFNKLIDKDELAHLKATVDAEKKIGGDLAQKRIKDEIAKKILYEEMHKFVELNHTEPDRLLTDMAKLEMKINTNGDLMVKSKEELIKYLKMMSEARLGAIVSSHEQEAMSHGNEPKKIKTDNVEGIVDSHLTQNKYNHIFQLPIGKKIVIYAQQYLSKNKEVKDEYDGEKTISLLGRVGQLATNLFSYDMQPSIAAGIQSYTYARHAIGDLAQLTARLTAGTATGIVGGAIAKVSGKEFINGFNAAAEKGEDLGRYVKYTIISHPGEVNPVIAEMENHLRRALGLKEIEVEYSRRKRLYNFYNKRYQIMAESMSPGQPMNMPGTIVNADPNNLAPATRDHEGSALAVQNEKKKKKKSFLSNVKGFNK
jgi:hypothetical protein